MLRILEVAISGDHRLHIHDLKRAKCPFRFLLDHMPTAGYLSSRATDREEYAGYGKVFLRMRKCLSQVVLALMRKMNVEDSKENDTICRKFCGDCPSYSKPDE